MVAADDRKQQIAEVEQPATVQNGSKDGSQDDFDKVGPASEPPPYTAQAKDGEQITPRLSSDGPTVEAVKGGTRGLQPPEFLRHLTMEERLALEDKLKKKIDWRLLPYVIVMYILNYIDR